MTFLYHVNAGLYCSEECAKADNANLRLLEETTAYDFQSDFESLDEMEDSDYWYWTEASDNEDAVCSPQCGHCCDHCMDVCWE